MGIADIIFIRNEIKIGQNDIKFWDLKFSFMLLRIKIQIWKII